MDKTSQYVLFLSMRGAQTTPLRSVTFMTCPWYSKEFTD